MNELINTKKLSVASLFAGEGVDELLAEVRSLALQHEPDLRTKRGRSAVGGMARKVSSSKTYLDNLGKELVADKKAEIKGVDSIRKAIRDGLDTLRDEVRKPLTEWERAEEERIKEIEEVLNWLNNLATDFYAPDGRPLSSSDYASRISKLDDFDAGQSFDEFTDKMLVAHARAQSSLQTRYDEALTNEAEAAELAELRRIKAEQEQKAQNELIAMEAAAKATADAENKAAAERAEIEQQKYAAVAAQKMAERREAEAKKQAELAAKQAVERAESEKARAVEAEKQRHIDEVEQQRKEQAARESDKAHRRTVNSKALHAMVESGIDKAVAKAVLQLIASGGVPNVSINY